jgi:hypothetical protein
MKSGMRVGNWVRIEWRDAVGANGWVSLKKFKKGLMKDCHCISVGKLVEVTNEYIIYAPGINKITKDLQRPGFIPMSLIMSIERVEPVKIRRKKK